MDKSKMQTPDLTEENIKRLAALFPKVITETKDGSGIIKKVVDFDLLKQVLSKDIVEGDDERYRLDWPGKKAALLKANMPITKTLRPCREESVNFDTTENLYIEGDNFEVLKVLQESYLGKVKMIYIDPPYNTGNDFIYKDDFSRSKEEYESEIGAIDEEGNKIFKENTKTNPRYHSDWLSMMYERLLVSRDLLKDDGVVFISIDDNEVHNLRKICDEVFGEENQLGTIIWETATDNNPSQISMEHEYVLVYAKCRDKQSIWQRKSEKVKFIINKYGELKSEGIKVEEIQKRLRAWINANKKSNDLDLSGVSHYNYVDEKGVYYPGNSANTKLGGYIQDIIHPITGKICAKPENGYRWPEKTFNEADARGDVLWGEDESTVPKIKKRIDTATELFKSYFYQDNRGTTNLVKSLFGGKKIFDNPKSMDLIVKVIDFSCGKFDLILDFFSGSATTAHAVMQLNAEDGGYRRFIMVQLPEKTEENSEAYKAGYKTIADIGKERIRRAGKKIVEELKAKNQQLELGQEPVDASKLDVGYRVYKTDESNMKDVFYHPAKLDQKQLLDLVSNIKEDRTPEDLLTQVILDLGLELSLPIETKKIGKNKVFIVQTNALIACFDNDIDFKVVDTIAGLKPFKVVFKDASFKDDKDRINVEERFKRLSPETKVTVI